MTLGYPELSSWAATLWPLLREGFHALGMFNTESGYEQAGFMQRLFIPQGAVNETDPVSQNYAPTIAALPASSRCGQWYSEPLQRGVWAPRNCIKLCAMPQRGLMSICRAVETPHAHLMLLPLCAAVSWWTFFALLRTGKHVLCVNQEPTTHF